MEHKLYRLTAFAKTENGGNPAGVVLPADELTAAQMQQIAKEVGYSETAFVMKSDVADFKVKFFTPTDEVDLCGHATIATFNLLRDLKIIAEGEYTQETKAGILKLNVHKSEVYMEQNLPIFGEVIPEEEVYSCFKSQKTSFVNKDLPIQVVSTGLREIFIPIKDLSTLNELTQNNIQINEVCKKYNAIGIHAFTLETLGNADAHARNFAPLVGIDEESATGTANGALACYIHKNKGNKSNFVIEQGYCMGKPSEIKVNLTLDKEQIVQVCVGGNAKLIKP